MVDESTTKPQTSMVVTPIQLIRQVHRSAWAVQHILFHTERTLQQ